MAKKICFFLILPLFLTSCFDKRMKNPETVDLIYLDIQEDIEKIERVIKLREVEIQTVRGEMSSLPPRSKGLKVKQNRIDLMSADITRFEQLKKYMAIKLRKRKHMAQIRYELSYHDNKEWPDKEEFRKYSIVKKHSHIPIEEINKSDNSRSPTHKRDVGKILQGL